MKQANKHIPFMFMAAVVAVFFITFTPKSVSARPLLPNAISTSADCTDSGSCLQLASSHTQKAQNRLKKQREAKRKQLQRKREAAKKSAKRQQLEQAQPKQSNGQRQLSNQRRQQFELIQPKNRSANHNNRTKQPIKPRQGNANAQTNQRAYIQEQRPNTQGKQSKKERQKQQLRQKLAKQPSAANPPAKKRANQPRQRQPEQQQQVETQAKPAPQRLTKKQRERAQQQVKQERKHQRYVQEMNRRCASGKKGSNSKQCLQFKQRVVKRDVKQFDEEQATQSRQPRSASETTKAEIADNQLSIRSMENRRRLLLKNGKKKEARKLEQQIAQKKAEQNTLGTRLASEQEAERQRKLAQARALEAERERRAAELHQQQELATRQSNQTTTNRPIARSDKSTSSEPTSVARSETTAQRRLLTDTEKEEMAYLRGEIKDFTRAQQEADKKARSIREEERELEKDLADAEKDVRYYTQSYLEDKDDPNAQKSAARALEMAAEAADRAERLRAKKNSDAWQEELAYKEELKRRSDEYDTAIKSHERRIEDLNDRKGEYVYEAPRVDEPLEIVSAPRQRDSERAGGNSSARDFNSLSITEKRSEIANAAEQSRGRLQKLTNDYNAAVAKGDRKGQAEALAGMDDEVKRAEQLLILKRQIEGGGSAEASKQPPRITSPPQIASGPTTTQQTNPRTVTKPAEPQSSANDEFAARDTKPAAPSNQIEDTKYPGIYWICDDGDCHPFLRDSATLKEKLHYKYLRLGKATDYAVKNPSDTLDATQRGLDAASLLPGVGTAADGANALISGLRYTYSAKTGNWEVANEHRSAAISSGLGLVIPGGSGGLNKSAISTGKNLSNLNDARKLTPLPNQFPSMYKAEVEDALNAGARRWRIGDSGFEDAVNSDRIKYVVLENGELIVSPRSVNGVEISHAFLSEGRGVIAAGEADITLSGGKAVGIYIDNGSGHFTPPDNALEVAEDAFRKLGINSFIERELIK